MGVSRLVAAGGLALVAATLGGAVGWSVSSQTNGTGPQFHTKNTSSQWTNTWPSATCSTARWVDVPGATVSFKVPNATTDAALIRFSSQAAVQDGADNGISARVLVDGIEATPQISSPELFPAGPDHGTTYVERDAAPLAAGRHSVTVQVEPDGSDPCSGEWTFDGWTLTVENWKQTP